MIAAAALRTFQIVGWTVVAAITLLMLVWEAIG